MLLLTSWSLRETRGDSDLRTWGLALREKLGFKRAAIAVARKLAVIMHAMLKSGELFNKTVSVFSRPPCGSAGSGDVRCL